MYCDSCFVSIVYTDFHAYSFDAKLLQLFKMAYVALHICSREEVFHLKYILLIQYYIKM